MLGAKLELKLIVYLASYHVTGNFGEVFNLVNSVKIAKLYTIHYILHARLGH